MTAAQHPGKNVLRLLPRLLRRLWPTSSEPPPLTVPASLYAKIRDLHDELLELDQAEALGRCDDAPGVDGGCAVCNLTTATQEAFFTWRPEEAQ